MRQNTWMRAVTFNEKYNLKSQNIYTLRRNHKDMHWCKYLPYSKTRKALHINETFVLRVQKFREDLTREAEALYFELIETSSLTALSIELVKRTSYNNFHSWEVYLSTGLFKVRSERNTILDIRVVPMMIAFVRAARRIKKELHD